MGFFPSLHAVRVNECSDDSDFDTTGSGKGEKITNELL